MNKNFKVVWNRSLGCFTAVAEYAKSRGKSSSGAVTSTSRASSAVVTGARLLRLSSLYVALAATGLTLSPQVFAAYGIGGGTLVNSNYKGSTAISATDCNGAQSGLGEAKVNNSLAIAIGCSSLVESDRGIAIGSESLAGGNNESIALGRQAKARGGSIHCYWRSS